MPVLHGDFMTHQKHKGPKGKKIDILDFIKNIFLVFSQCQESEKDKPQNGRIVL